MLGGDIIHKCLNPNCNIMLEDYDKRKYCSHKCCNSSPEHRKISSDTIKKLNSLESQKLASSIRITNYNKSEKHKLDASKSSKLQHINDPSIRDKWIIYLQRGRLKSYWKDQDKSYLYLFKSKQYNCCKLGASINIDYRISEYDKEDIYDIIIYSDIPDKIADLEYELKLKYFEERIHNDISRTECFNISCYDKIKSELNDWSDYQS